MRAYLFPPAGSTSYVAADSKVSLAAAIVNASLLRQLLTMQVTLQLTVALIVLIPTARHNS